MKKQTKLFASESRKKQAKTVRCRMNIKCFSSLSCMFLQEREKQDMARREKNLEEAKKITIEEDKSLPSAKIVEFLWFY